MKVDEQSELPSAKLQIAEQLSLVDGQQRVDSFHLHHNHSRGQEVQPVATVELSSFVMHRKRFLPFEGNFSQCQLLRQTLFVSRF